MQKTLPLVLAIVFLIASLSVSQVLADYKVFDRKTQQYVVEKVPLKVDIALETIYTFATVARDSPTKLMLKEFTKRCLRYRTTKTKSNEKKVSRAIKEFATEYGLDLSHYEKTSLSEYVSVNDLFTRKIMMQYRPIAHDTEVEYVAVSPADNRLTVFPTVSAATKLWIKGKEFSVLKLLGNDQALGTIFESGSLAIARLAPQDYHRFHSPVNGQVQLIVDIPGAYYSVNPIAVNKNIDVFTDNKRSIVILDSIEFGRVAYVVVGATCVGSIQYSVQVGDTVTKGQELGYFQFGGSTVIVMFEEGKIQFDSDLLHMSTKHTETLVQVGTSLGRTSKKV